MSGRNRSRNKRQGSGQGSRSNRGGNRSRNKKQKLDPVAFWGDMAKLPSPDRFDTESPEPLSVVHSLGPAPVPGVLAEPYFAAVYDRGAVLAAVLSDAAGLDDLSPVEISADEEGDGDDLLLEDDSEE